MQNILSKIKAFPSMPNAVAKVLRIVDDPDVSILEVEEALKYDPGLTANILKLTNSAYFGLSTEIGSVRRAVLLLGLKRVVQIVMTSCVNALMDSEVAGYELPVGELWRHSIAVSVASESIVKQLKIQVPEELFTAALLHDIGKVILGDFVKDSIMGVEANESEGKSFHIIEAENIGADHAEIGARILKSWSLPDTIVNAVRWHHDPDLADVTNPLIDIVHIADVLCLIMGIGIGREGLTYEPSTGATERLGLKRHHLEFVASQTLHMASELSEVLTSN